MKLRLPLHLLRAVVFVLGLCSAQAAIRHSDVSLQTYVDFATNSGRYVTGASNELLDYIRQRDGGVKIEYTGGQAAYTLPNGMISFGSVADLGNGTLTGYNYMVTVAHNGVLYPSFGGNVYGVGATNALRYSSIEELNTANGSFVHKPGKADYKLSRLSKLVTDAESATIYQPTYNNGKTDMSNALVYRVGGGDQTVKDLNGNSTYVSYAGTYTVGGVGSVSTWSDTTAVGSVEDIKNAQVSGKGEGGWGHGGVSSSAPLPFGSATGDSGSPYFVWNADSKQFELLMAHTGSYNDGEIPAAAAAPQWTLDTLAADSVRVDMGKVKGALKIQGAAKSADKGGVTDSLNGTSFTVSSAKGYLAHDDGNLYDSSWNSVVFNGVGTVTEDGAATNTWTWKSLSELKNQQAWYAYGDGYLNAGASVTWDDNNNPVVNENLTYSELYLTQNLVFEAAADNAKYTINVTQDTDLGLGYLHFAAEKVSGVEFTINAAGSNQLNSAGYVVDAGVQVNVKLRNADADYMREWRKVGEGTLNICGNDNNEIFLNVGGKGKTLLNQEKGYAAYNVLVNTGSTVVIKDTTQIYRDLTFGTGGGTLDMNGNKMDWYLSGGETRDGFTINALTEEAVISNSSADRAELRFMESGNQKFVGSFRDSKDSALGIIYAGGGTWELNSIRTCLENADSGLTVEKGTVKLSGSLTVHGYGSKNDLYSADFSTRDKDWHYADAKMNVTVQKGATFELESHARLTGTVTVQEGGKYIMHEGVQYDQEYIEGGEKLESTAAIKAYYGHKGDVKLAKDATLSWQRGSKEVASLKGNSAAGSLAGVETTISSETQLTLAAAGVDDGKITAADLTLQGGVTLSLKKLMLDAASSITSAGAAMVDMQDATLQVAADNAVVKSAALSDTLQLTTAGGVDWIYLNSGSTLLDVQSNALSGALTISGSMLTVDFTALGMVDAAAIRLQFGKDVKFTALDKMQLVALTMNGTMVGYYNQNDNSTAYFTLIPEPATSTLSLLALAALAARRRRK